MPQIQIVFVPDTLRRGARKMQIRDVSGQVKTWDTIAKDGQTGDSPTLLGVNVTLIGCLLDLFSLQGLLLKFQRLFLFPLLLPKMVQQLAQLAGFRWANQALTLQGADWRLAMIATPFRLSKLVRKNVIPLKSVMASISLRGSAIRTTRILLYAPCTVPPCQTEHGAVPQDMFKSSVCETRRAALPSALLTPWLSARVTLRALT
jgi:hypothetical protein